MVGDAGGFDQLFSPGYRLKGLDPNAEKPRKAGEGGGDIQIAVVGSPAECGAQVGQSALIRSLLNGEHVDQR